jgi:GTPase SAR1 family protein
LQFWLDELNNYAPKDIIICFLGNQSDRTADRKVEFEEAKNLAGDNLYYEVSAKAGNNITLAFEALTNNIIDKQKEEEKNPDKVKRGKEGRNTIDINSNKNQGNEKKKKCC